MTVKPVLVLISGKARSGKDTSGDILAELLKDLHGMDSVKVPFAEKIKEIASSTYNLTVDEIYGDRKESPLFRWSTKERYKILEKDVDISDDDNVLDFLIKVAGDRHNQLKRFYNAGLLKVDTYKRHPYGVIELEITKYLSPRIIMQDIGQGMRDTHPDVWVNTSWRKAFKHLQSGKSVLITDCRYLNEVKVLDLAASAGFNTIALRMLRDSSSDIAMHKSEHHDWFDDVSYRFTLVSNNGVGSDGLSELKTTLKGVLSECLNE